MYRWHVSKLTGQKFLLKHVNFHSSLVYTYRSENHHPPLRPQFANIYFSSCTFFLFIFACFVIIFVLFNFNFYLSSLFHLFLSYLNFPTFHSSFSFSPHIANSPGGGSIFQYIYLLSFPCNGISSCAQYSRSIFFIRFSSWNRNIKLDLVF
jgi:hypothetical protein